MTMPPWAQALPWDAIVRVAGRHGLDPQLVAAFCRVESSGQRYATRFEKNYRWLSDPQVHARELGLSFDTEVVAQSHSYGLMQIMGATARSFGFKGYCVELCNVDDGLEYGCRYLGHCIDRFRPLEHAIAAYNAGSPRDVAPADGVLDNQAYVDKVLKSLAELSGAPKTVA